VTLKRRLAVAVAGIALTGTGVLATIPATAQAGEAAASAATDCVWRVATNGAPVWAKDGHGNWYVHHRKEIGSRARGPGGEGPDWVKVYMGAGGEGLMGRWDLRLRSGPCQ
jgi:hypothetical protein